MDILEWKDAMKNELDALVGNGTWKLVSLLDGHKVVPCKWVFRIKFQNSNDLDKYKICLVLKGFSQSEDVDYFETLWLNSEQLKS